MDMLPLFIMILVMPLIVRFHVEHTTLGSLSWLPDSMSDRIDFFLYGKSRTVLLLAGSMLVFIADRFIVRGGKAGNIKCLLPLLGYELLAVLSAVFSKTPEYTKNGIIEQYEGVYVLLAYGMIAAYSYLVVQDKRHVDLIFGVMLTAGAVQSVFGIVEICGKELLSTTIAKKMILGNHYQKIADYLVFNFIGEKYQRVSGTLYNSNYAGVFFGMILILSICLTIVWQGWKRIYAAGVSVLSLVCLIGSGSKSAALGVFILFMMLAALMGCSGRRKQCFCLLAGIIGIIGGYLIYDGVTGVQTVQRIVKSLTVQQKTEKLTDIQVLSDHITITWDGQAYSLSMKKRGKGLYMHVLDGQGEEVSLVSDEKKQICWMEPVDAEELYFQCYYKEGIAFLSMEHEGIQWLFTDDLDGQYTYINIWGKPDTIEKAPQFLFQGKESMFTNRGYIFSRIIPLLKKYVFAGSGPDTFLLQFPQNDYVARAALGYGFFSEIITKPHCMYLQIAVQTGILSLICFLLLPVGTAIGYLRKQSKYVKKAEKKQSGISYIHIVASLVFFYLLTGCVNDSMIGLAPFYWMLLGIFMKMCALDCTAANLLFIRETAS